MTTEQPASLTRAEEQLVSYLRQTADALGPPARAVEERWVYTSQFDLLLREGRLFTPAPLPDGTEQLDPGWCFTNAAQLATDHPDLQLTYAEGYGSAPIAAGQALHTPHAWAATPDGSALDPTWPHEPGTAFLGLPFADPAMWPHPLLGRSLLQEPPFLHHLLRSGLPDGLLADLGRPLPR
ncbi:hypothetical protein [Mangrovactinospora gilvigrisea]|uniref:hypothetical protein n=1 Tax=Mangrovactinospora gilvigrisea TaxID=1428644 RepID=UPI0008FC3D76|nr:hypothetical protein [Mangrovactinospora gilvigrisea]